MLIVPVSVSAGRDAGERIRRAGLTSADIVAALIVAAAVEARADHILTGDPNDLWPLCGADLEVIPL